MTESAFETLAIRTQMERTQKREHSTPLFLNSSFTFDSAEQASRLFQGEEKGNIYSRFSNPNTDELVQKMCALEKCSAGVATASGMAAVYTALVAHLKIGDHLIASSAIFGNSRHIIEHILPSMGVQTTLVPVDEHESYLQAIGPETKMIFVESPSNPSLKIANLRLLGELAEAHDILLAVDNCFATPYLQNPIELGAHLIIHSATKYLDGQGRVMGGLILGDENAISPCYDFLRRTGACLSPFNAWVLSKSLETLALRIDRHCDNAEKLAAYLSQHEDFEEISYPHHASHPQVAIAKKQMRRGGGLVAGILKGGAQRGAAFLNALRIHSLTANLGDTRSIATHPASTTHSKLSSEEQLAVDIRPGSLRFSVGLEHIEDIIKDIEQALIKSKKH